MKDIVIPEKSIRREKWAFVVCIVVALLINAAAIIAYKTQWIELLTTWHYTLAVALLLYFITGLPRLCWIGFRSLFKTRKSA